MCVGSDGGDAQTAPEGGGGEAEKEEEEREHAAGLQVTHELDTRTWSTADERAVLGTPPCSLEEAAVAGQGAIEGSTTPADHAGQEEEEEGQQHQSLTSEYTEQASKDRPSAPACHTPDEQNVGGNDESGHGDGEQ